MPKDLKIQIRVTAELRERLKAGAEHARLPLSLWLINLGLAECDRFSIPDPVSPPKRRTKRN